MGGYETRGNLRTTGGASNAGAAAITQAQVGGAPARAYMNEKIVPHLLEGMKSLAKEQYVFASPLLSALQCTFLYVHLVRSFYR